MVRTLAFIAGASLLSIGASPALAEASTQQFRIGGYVPAICRAQFNGAGGMTGQNTYDLGRLDELCNVEEGYEVVLVHRSDLAGKVTIGSQEIALSPSGQTVISQSDHARIASTQVALSVDGGLPASISLRVNIRGAWI